MFKWSDRESHPDLQRAELASSCWTMTPMRFSAEAVGLEPTSGSQPPPVFKTGSSSGRMASVVKLRRLELNQHDDVQSVSSYRWMTPHRLPSGTRLAEGKFGEEGSNLRRLVQGQEAYH